MILQVSNLSKSFAGVKALDNVCFALQKGEVHALVGENGAGKSTFMKILMGLITADSGEVVLDGEVLKNLTVQERLQKGISMIHQEILTVPELTLAQNIFLGRESTSGFMKWLNDDAMNHKAGLLLQELGLSINPKTPIKQLSVSEMQMVEIAKAISNNAKVIIMDEPTSAISDKEVGTLFDIIRGLKSKGVAIIYISHKMDEIYEIADRVTVLRDGQYIDTMAVESLNKNTLVSLMVGRAIENLYPTTIAKTGKAVLSVRNLTQKGKFSNISFDLHKGEVLGIAGLMGAGRSEIARAIYGLDKYDSGDIFIEDQKITIHSPKEAIKNGIGYVSEDRKGWGFVPKLSIKHNISLTHLPNYHGWILSQNEEEITDKMAKNLKIKALNNQQQVTYLSGGNQQKVVIAKMLLASPKIVILDEPTRGVDVGAKFEIYTLIRQLTNRGISVIMISSELPEILGMSDRVLVLSKGKQTALLSHQEATQETIMHYAIH